MQAKDVHEMLWALHHVLKPTSTVELADAPGEVGFEVTQVQRFETKRWETKERFWMRLEDVGTNAPEWMGGKFAEPAYRLQVARAVNGTSPAYLKGRV